MRQISIFLLLFTALGLYPSFKILDSSKQKYHGGIPSAGYGMRYKIVLLAKTNYEHMAFDKLYVDGAELDIQIRDKKANPLMDFKKGDTLYLYAVKHIQTDRVGNKLPEQSWTKAKFPIKYDGEAILKYYLNTKEKFAKISQFKKLPSENRP